MGFVTSLSFHTQKGSVCSSPTKSSSPDPTNVFNVTYQPSCHLSYIKGMHGEVVNSLSFCFTCGHEQLEAKTPVPTTTPETDSATSPSPVSGNCFWPNTN